MSEKDNKESIVSFIENDIRFLGVRDHSNLIADIIVLLSSTEEGMLLSETEKVLDETKNIILALVRI